MSSSEALARRIAGIADAKQGSDIVALDVRALVSYTDFLVICTVRNERQTKGVHDAVREELKADGVIPSRVEGETSSSWVLMDYLDCVLHVLTEETRAHYRLEQLWGEAARLELDGVGVA